MSLTYCALVEGKRLDSFLHTELTCLNLRGCPKLTTKEVTTIAKRCSKLRELYLSDCTGIRSLDDNGWFVKQELEFPSLEVLHIARSQIESLAIKAPKLRELKANKNPKLRLENISTSLLSRYSARSLAVNLDKSIGIEMFDSFFGAQQWREMFGEVGAEPPLPASLVATLSTPCPFWPDKKVYETHLLVLIPKTVDGEPLTLELMGKLVEKPKQGHPTKYNSEFYYPHDHEKTAVSESHWLLFTKDVIPGSRKKRFAEQKELLRKYGEYETPKLLDATVAIFVEYVQRGVRYYSVDPLTYTRCQEQWGSGSWQMVVGGFAAAGLGVLVNGLDLEFGTYGLAGVRKI